VSENLSGNFA